MGETGKLRSAASGGMGSRASEQYWTMEDKQVPKHLEMNGTELFKTENEGLIKPSFDPWKGPGTNKDFKFLEDN